MLTQKAIIDLICLFVEKSGGLEKIKLAAKGLRQVAEANTGQEYVTAIAKSPGASNQLLAAALLGFRIAELVYEGSSEKTKKLPIN